MSACRDCRTCSGRCRCWCHQSDEAVRREGELAAAERRGFSEGAESQREANAKALRDLAAMFAPASAMRSHLEAAAEHLSSLPLVGVTRKDSTDE